MSKIISAESFMKKATRVIDIPGFEPGEVFSVKVKNVGVLSMIIGGKLPNSLLVMATQLFPETQSSESLQENTNKLLDDPEALKSMSQMMRAVVKEALVEPKFDDIAEGITDEQVQSIFTQVVGTTNKAIPTVQE
uniref:Uncharacterized protein n=1 Tax=Siphoviridae sp. ctG7D9 TaxID=2826218 RepID=A0A8S5MC26_9CAUD|nr:MAG TPA: hypothetical protein [Siphoviridae sp. ctG7D9]